MGEVIDDIRNASKRVLEDWAMMAVDEISSEQLEFDDRQKYYVASVQFKGVISGVYAIVCQEVFVDNLIANLLGNEATHDYEARMDALREMANVLSGNLITETYGADLPFDLVYPTVSVTDGPNITHFLNERVISFKGDDEPVAITFALDME